MDWAEQKQYIFFFLYTKDYYFQNSNGSCFPGTPEPPQPMRRGVDFFSFLESEDDDDDVDDDGGGSVRLSLTPPSGGKWNVSMAKRLRRSLNAKSLLPPADNTDNLVLGGSNELMTGNLCT